MSPASDQSDQADRSSDGSPEADPGRSPGPGRSAPAPPRRVRADYRPAPLRRTGAAHGKLFAALIVGLLVVGVLLTWSAARTGRTDPERLQLGDRFFDVGRAEALAKGVEKNGPLLFQDPLGGTRHLYVQYLGSGRWTAFPALRPGQPETCVLRWQAETGTFRDPCDGTVVAADGGALVHYRAAADAKGRLVVDLNTQVTVTTKAPAPTTSLVTVATRAP